MASFQTSACPTFRAETARGDRDCVAGGRGAASWREAGIFLLVCVLVAELAHLLSKSRPGFGAFWLPAGVSTAVLLGRHPREWPGFMTVALAAGLAVDLRHGTGWFRALGFAATSASQALLAAWTVRRFVAARPALETLWEFVVFVGFATIASPMVAAVPAAAVIASTSRAPFARAWENCWSGLGLVVLLLGSAVLAWQRPGFGRFRRLQPAQLLEGAVLVGGLTACTVCPIVIGDAMDVPHKVRLMLFALWAGLRFGLRGATAVNLWFALLLVVLTQFHLRGLEAGVFDAREFLATLPSFLAVNALVGLVPALALRERDAKLRELRESEERFRRKLDALPLAAFTCNARGAINYFNRQAERLWGRVPRILEARNRYCGSHRMLDAGGNEVPRERSFVARALAEQREVKGECVIERPDGTRRTLLAHASPLFAPDGALAGAVNVLVDITEQKAAREAQLEGEAMLRQFIKYTPAAVAMFDTEMRYLHVSDRWLTDYGHEEAGLIGRLHYEVVPHIPDRWKAVHRRVLEGAVERCEEDVFIRPDGATEWIEWETRPWRKPDGRIGGLTMFTQLITERVRMKEALRASEERFRSALQHSPIGMALVGTDGRLLEANPALGAIFGHPPGELFSRTMHALVSPADVAGAPAELWETPAGPRESFQVERPCRHWDGRPLWVQVSGSLVRHGDGRPRHFVVQVQDLTGQRRAEEQRAKLEQQLRQAQKMEAIGTLAGGIAHDFNNILAGIMGNLQLAGLELAGGHPVAPLLGEALRASRRARDLVARILTFSRRTEHERKPTLLGPIVEETVQLLRASVPATIEIHVAVAPRCPPVRCDGAQIHQVLLNLGGNAAGAMRQRGGRMEITLRHETPPSALREMHPQVGLHHTVRLTVRDNGHGMSAAVRERIFEPFFTTRGPGEGTGLGLAMVHGIVADLGGVIVVESEEGRGACFDLFLPGCAEPETPAAPEIPAFPAEPAFAQSGRGERIVVVDDDATVLAVAGAVLRRHGYRAETYQSPEGALAALEADPEGPALVVSDLTMPGLTGFGLARRIRELKPGLPVVIASGYLADRSRVEMESLALAGWLQKPYEVTALVAKVKGVLAASAAAGVSTA